ncbi:MAG TPA: hypothetical protein VET27_11420 [Mycobacterium sp.]|nr:hypothetical protein [Mycobacterium sp.]
MTVAIGAAARAVARPTTEIVAVNPADGPTSIESDEDENLCIPGLLDEVHGGSRDELPRRLCHRLLRRPWPRAASRS